jgi:hypothetical protein
VTSFKKMNNCDFCERFPAKVIRHHCFDNTKPDVALCQFCAEDPGVPKSKYSEDIPIEQEPAEPVPCCVCGKDCLLHFTLWEDKIYCPNCMGPILGADK